MTLDPNCYDSSKLRADRWQPQQRFRIVHTGSFTLWRWQPFFRALASLPEDHPFWKILSSFMQDLWTHTRRMFDQSGDWLKDHGVVPADAALELQRQADVLLIIDYQFGASLDAQYLPSKLTDYLAIRRPVVAITDVDSASWRFVHEIIWGAIAHNDCECLLVPCWSIGRHGVSGIDRVLGAYISTRYSAGTVAKQIADAAGNDCINETIDYVPSGSPSSLDAMCLSSLALAMLTCSWRCL